MQPAQLRQVDFVLVDINNAKSTLPGVSLERSTGSFPKQWLVIEPTCAHNSKYLSQIDRFASRLYTSK